MKHLKIIVLIPLLLASIVCFGQTKEVRQKHFYVEDDYAIDGYDPVAYLSENKALEGKESNSHTYMGITYLFATEENKNKFQENSEKYIPAYGGWCAYALAENGKKMEPDPETFRIQDGRTYLFYNGFFNNTLPKWEKKPQEFKKAADKVWTEMLKQ